jgi:signal transduction histidine kinase
VPIRVRLTASFSAAVILVLVASGLFVYVRLRADLDDAIDAELRARSAAVEELVRRSGPEVASSTPLEDVEESFVQIVDADGRLIDSAGTVRRPALSPAELQELSGEGTWVERDLPGVDGKARILARPVIGRQDLVVVVGQSMVNRDEALLDVRNSYAIGGPLAVIVASLLGYWLARLGLAPVEEMRRTAADVSARRTGRRLPLPGADDEIRQLGLTLNDMLDRLERSFDRERRFVSDAGHEFRTPIAVAKTELEAALRTGDYGPDVGDAIKAAIEECDCLAQLAEDLLVVARTDEGGLTLYVESMAARDLLDGVRDRFLDRARSRERAIVVDAGDGVFIGDRARLRQALGNLVDNSLRYGDGTVTLRASGTADVIVFDVSDEGAGFTADLVDRAFDRFSRGDQARTRAGAGLGLAIVRALAEAHGGDASIVDGGADSSGATVRLTMPTRPR